MANFPSSPGHIMFTYIREQGGAILSDTFLGKVASMPDQPVQCVGFYDWAGGKMEGRIMSTGEQVEKPGLQIRVRAATYPVGWAKANDIAQFCQGIRRVLHACEGHMYMLHNVSRKSPILRLGQDAKTQWGFSINYNLTITLEA
jgi:hypothetical protein